MSFQNNQRDKSNKTNEQPSDKKKNRLNTLGQLISIGWWFCWERIHQELSECWRQHTLDIQTQMENCWCEKSSERWNLRSWIMILWWSWTTFHLAEAQWYTEFMFNLWRDMHIHTHNERVQNKKYTGRQHTICTLYWTDNYGVNPSLIPNTEHMLWLRFRLVDNTKAAIESFTRFDGFKWERGIKSIISKRIASMREIKSRI